MNDLFSIMSGFVCSVYLVIPLFLGVFYIFNSFKEKILLKNILIIKNTVYIVIVLFSIIMITKINRGLLLFVSNQVHYFNDYTVSFLMLNTIILLFLILVGSTIRLIRINILYFINKREERCTKNENLEKE